MPMPTLYVENVPDELYDALKKRAKENRKSIAAEVLALLEENVPTTSELKRRRKVFEELRKVWAATPAAPGPFPSTEEMVREDRAR
jgi:plasmid stability protein